MYFAGGMGCPVEYFHGGFRPRFEARWQANGAAQLLEAAFRQRTDPGGTFTTKLFWKDLVGLAREFEGGDWSGVSAVRDGPPDNARLRDLGQMLRIRFPNPRFVHLFRRDTIRQGLSHHAAMETGRWRWWGMKEQPPVAYDFDRILNCVMIARRTQMMWNALFAVDDMRPIQIAYEDLLDDYDATVRRLFTALGHPDAVPPPPRLKRQTRPETEAMLVRFHRDLASRAVGGRPGKDGGTEEA
jgi:LPS sulfotransferase NodH